MTEAIAHLRALVDALPGEGAVTVPVGWVRELLERVDRPDAAALAGPDLTVHDLAERFARSPSTVRAWIEADRFPGAYRFQGREWRVPPAALATFEAAERDRPNGSQPARPRRGEVVNLGDWRKAT